MFELILSIFTMITCTTAGIGMIYAKNPISAILLLITIVTIASLNLLLLSIEFLGLVFLIVYVGAIAVLFLFILMMLNIKLLGTLLYIFDSYLLIIIAFILLISLVAAITITLYHDFMAKRQAVLKQNLRLST